uniref:Protein kinase domain-containing protein n=1 Tax=Caenorhabditis tropicalis TaxID=1561998 RepID=A0A1I7TN11_9PELO
MDRFINVANMDSRVQLIEKNVNGTFWSASSKMQFDAYDSFVNASFNSQYFHIDIAQCELLFGNSLESLLFMTTNRTSDGHSALTFSLYDNANMTLVEEGIEFQGINGRRIYIKSETWVRPVEKTISLGLSDENISGETAVELKIIAPVHMTSVRFVGAELLIKYGPNVVAIDPNFQKVIVYNDHYSYCLDTKSPGNLHVSFGNGLIHLDDGSSDFHVAVSPVDATVNSRSLSKTQVDRGDGPIFISGVPIYETGIKVNSLLLTLQLNNNGMMRADATGSEILMKTSIQNVGLTTEHQEIRITGGVPGLIIESGDVRFEVTRLSNPMAFTFLPGFSLPEDRFENIGPYSGSSRYSRPLPPLPVIVSPVIISAPGSNVPAPPLPPPMIAPAPPPPKIALPPDLLKFAADIAPVKKNHNATTTTLIPTTLKTTLTTTTMTTTKEDEDDEPSEKEAAKAKRRKEKMYREWESEENNVDNDGDTKEETFTYPNGTTVTRLINIRRKVTTKIVYKHRVEEDENGNNSTNPPFVFPDPEHLNYTKLATDCKGNEINFNLSNPFETSTGYHLVTFPTVGLPDQDTTTTRIPSTDNDFITETPTSEITLPTNPVTEVTVTPNPDSWSTESTTTIGSAIDTTIETTIETTTEVTSSTLQEDMTSQLPEESSTTSENQPLETTPGIETTTEEGSTINPDLLTSTENSVTEIETSTSEVSQTTEQVELTTEPILTETSTISTDISTDNPLTTSSADLAETTTVDLQSTSEPSETLLTTQETETSTETSVPTESQETTTIGDTTTIIMTTETYPLPSQLSTDDFVIGHWFSTEEVRTETTTEPSEIGITVSLGNVDFATTTEPEDGVPLPNELNINGESTPATTLETSTLEKGRKMLILKLQVPDDVDVNSSQFIRNITSSLRRLVRDVSTELKKRRKRAADVMSDETSEVYSIPVKVENITKTLNITVVTFALQFDPEVNDGEYELENALHNVNTNDLHRYFAYEPIEKISIDRPEIDEQKLREVLIASVVAFLLFLIIVFLYLKKKGILEKVFRKCDRIRCNALATRPSAFSPN